MPNLMWILRRGLLALGLAGTAGQILAEVMTPGGVVPLPRPAFAAAVVVVPGAAADVTSNGAAASPAPNGLATAPAPVAPQGAAPAQSLRPIPRDAWLRPVLRWDAHPRGDAWTRASLAALRRTSGHLAHTVPADIAEWCPGYAAASPGQRRAFWAGLVSKLAWYESTHRPQVVGGGRWFGLMQIAPATARARGCVAQTGEALLDGRANLACAVRIIGQNVARDGVVAQGRGGVAAEWAPFRSRVKQAEMRDWVRAQDYCQPQPIGVSLRPLRRPAAGLDTQ
jgi:hypothetical protein